MGKILLSRIAVVNAEDSKDEVRASKNPAYAATSTVQPTSQAVIIRENEPAYEVVLYGGQFKGTHVHVKISHADTIAPTLYRQYMHNICTGHTIIIYIMCTTPINGIKTGYLSISMSVPEQALGWIWN